MSRSSYIYTAQNHALHLVAAFTVRWELAVWLRQQQDPHVYTITRIKDGHHGDIGHHMDVDELLKIPSPYDHLRRAPLPMMEA